MVNQYLIKGPWDASKKDKMSRNHLFVKWLTNPLMKSINGDITNDVSKSLIR